MVFSSIMQREENILIKNPHLFPTKSQEQRYIKTRETKRR